MNDAPNRMVVPVGPGGVLGAIFRRCIFFISGGFIYPNVFIEGMDFGPQLTGHATTEVPGQASNRK